MSETLLKLSNAPEKCPIAFDLEDGTIYRDVDHEAPESTISMDEPAAVANLDVTKKHGKPDWLKQFYEQMNDFVGQASTHAVVDTESGLLELGPAMPMSDLKQVCGRLAWLFESQQRQQKEILIWIGEIILDYIARASHDISIEEAIEGLGLLDRHGANGVKWKARTLARWPAVVQRIPPEIRQLPIPQTYLAEAAMFRAPEDPEDLIKFGNARDAILLAAADEPDQWSRKRVVNCIREVQEAFNVERNRNENVASLQGRLITLYRLRHEADAQIAYGPDAPETFLAAHGLSRGEMTDWIYNIEAELIHRDKMPVLPTDDIPTSDGLTQSARDRIEKDKQAKQQP